MPTYEYRCKECGHEFEAVQAFSDDSLTECPVCQGALRKVFGNVGITFKGSGFYKNDSRASSKSTSSSSDSGGADATTKKESASESSGSSSGSKDSSSSAASSGSGTASKDGAGSSGSSSTTSAKPAATPA